MSLAKRVRELRLKSGLSLSGLSRLSGVSRSRLHDIELGSNTTGVDIYIQISRTLLCSLEFPLTGNKNKKDNIHKKLIKFNS